ncbi:hypothetical protein [Tardiphaga sp.]|jgi:hypothetical protein|uniref:hypothetical protein n=1 Tax=Tardiphaga sp. TaxID=1926292 RepID=UPI0037D9D03D
MPELAAELHFAIILLKNYAKFDEENGDIEDAAFTRMHIARFEAALPSQWRSEDAA